MEHDGTGKLRPWICATSAPPQIPPGEGRNWSLQESKALVCRTATSPGTILPPPAMNRRRKMSARARRLGEVAPGEERGPLFHERLSALVRVRPPVRTLHPLALRNRSAHHARGALRHPAGGLLLLRPDRQQDRRHARHPDHVHRQKR